MPNAAEWTALIAEKEAAPPSAVNAHTYLRTRFSSISKPALMACSDGHEYVTKSIANPGLRRAMANDQVMGRAAVAMSAPVPPVALVNVPQELINAQPELVDFIAGVTHGSRYMPDVSKTREGIAHVAVPENRGRFASLAAFSMASLLCSTITSSSTRMVPTLCGRSTTGTSSPTVLTGP